MSIESKLTKFGRFMDKVVLNIERSIKVMFRNEEKLQKSKTKPNSSVVVPAFAILLFDSFMAFLSLFISIHLRIGMDFLDYSPMYIIKNMFVFGLVSSSVFLWFQTHQSFWRYSTVEDMVPIFISVILSNILFFPLMMLMNQEDFLPYSVLVINVFVLSFMLIIPRLLSKTLYEQKIKKMRKNDKLARDYSQVVDVPPVLVVGCSQSVEGFLRDVVSNDDIIFNFDPIGILTLDPEEVGRVIKGVPIIGELRDINIAIRALYKDGVNPRQIVITEKSLPENAKKFLIRYGQEHGLLLMHVMHQCTFNTVVE